MFKPNTNKYFVFLFDKINVLQANGHWNYKEKTNRKSYEPPSP